MNIDAAAAELAIHIERLANIPVKFTENQTENHKKGFSGLLRDLFSLLENPQDETSQKDVILALRTQLASIAISSGGLLKAITLPDNIDKAGWLCVLAAQITVMLGTITLKSAFNNKLYFHLYNKNFPEWAHPHCDDWGRTGVNLLYKLGHYQTVFDAALYNDDFETVTSLLNVFKSKQIDANKYLKASLEFALRHKKLVMVQKLLLKMHPEMPALFATRMISQIESSGLIEANHLKYRVDKNTFHDDLTALIKLLVDNNLLAVAPESLDNIKHEAIIKPRTTPGLINLKNYESEPTQFSGQLDCAPAEIDEVFEILVTILDKLKDDTTRNTFLHDQTFYKTPIPFTPGILCALSFQIAAILGGHHSQDGFIVIKTYKEGLQRSLRENMTSLDLTRWQSRILVMLELFTPIPMTEGDIGDNSFDLSQAQPTQLLPNPEEAIRRNQDELKNKISPPMAPPALTTVLLTPLMHSQIQRGRRQQNRCGDRCKII
ncbi:MAG: hypothetical protein ACHQAX_03335 [Gammaproteobacteria bacterium]